MVFLAAVTLLAFGNTLGNELIGDAKSLYGQNQFYKHPKNLKRLFQKDFIMSPAQMGESPSGETSFSGCLSYRPVTALTFFVDYSLWKENVFGHHATNLLLHLATCWLVFLFVFELTQQHHTALFAAILFCVHPIQSEILNHTGYRSDQLLAIFYLLGFLSYLRSRAATGLKSAGWTACVLACLALALFSKEAALTFPVMIFFYEWLCSDETLPRVLRRHLRLAAGFFVVAGSYLYIYLIAIPNGFYPKFLYFGWNTISNLIIALKILGIYFTALAFPLSVNVLPPVYAPPVNPYSVWGLTLVTAVILFCAFFTVKYFRKQKAIVLGMVWFFLNDLPVSNMVPIPNPLAFRFMYLPCIGFFMILALLTERVIAKLRQGGNESIGKILKLTLVAFYLCLTIPLNTFFKNNIVTCREMIRQYPDSSRPYWILGVAYSDRKEYEKAAEYFLEHIRRGVNNPYIHEAAETALTHYMIGMCYVDRPALAVVHFKKTVELNPNDVRALIMLSKCHMIQKDFSAGVGYALKAMAFNDRYFLPYVYAVHGYTQLGEFDKADDLLKKVKLLAPDELSVKKVEQFLWSQRNQAHAK